ncbi:hypothetical protein A3A63_03770 [Candidatus Gottesmanbacteria bacterium RIFCSPLOWO2_01_FULL_46_9]|uniref:Nudix hydrolase domain-containing protein n=1 Tax=Candidatus Gottesmanbacteria bacterium RIFCSPLOWO2_01_FULL_46_9 TaxID=1798394 RepID=A0A1F6B1J9_9BACT|nr:MAG: hypothetical protein A3A63_03770 [Candidatus Gottesmanbacteria bacterium RIFCSPLOWO2_01_FULL_46_9]
MKTAISAGGIVVRKYRGSWQILLLKDMNNAWTFPKGLIEEGEKKKEAAEREIGEEVGLSELTYMAPVANIQYMYKRNGLIAKTVYYFLFRYTGVSKPVCQKSEGIKDAQWYTLSDALSVIGYDTNISLIKKTGKLLSVI